MKTFARWVFDWILFCLSMIWYFVNTNAYYLGAQSIATLGGVGYLAYKTKKDTVTVDDVFWLSSAACLIYMWLYFWALKRRVELETRIEETRLRINEVLLQVGLKVVRGALTCIFARFVCFFSDSIKIFESESALTIAVYLLAYLHVVSLCKQFGIEDKINFSDGLLAIAILVMAALELGVVPGVETKKNTCGSPGSENMAPRASPGLHTAGSLLLRIIYSYGSSILLVAYKTSNPPLPTRPAPALNPNPAGLELHPFQVDDDEFFEL